MSQQYSRRKPGKNSPGKESRKVSPWLWLATGLGTGLLLCFLYHLGSLPREADARGDSEKDSAARAEQEDGVEFNFYTLLPQREVLVSTERQPSRAKPPSTSKQKAVPGYHYYLQAGSFQQREEAEKRRIQLILLDMNANIEKVKHQGKSWYRVQSGPYSSTSQLAKVQGKLSSEGIDTLVTKRKTD